MTARSFPRDIYDLYYRRGKKQFVGFEDEAPWTKQQVTDFQKRNQLLDDMSKTIRIIFEKRDALIFCQHFLTCILETWPFCTTYLHKPPCTTALPPSRPDRNNEEDELRARLESAARDQFLQPLQVLTLKQLCHTVRRRIGENPPQWEGPHLLYRVHRPDSHTVYAHDVGFCCPKWLRERNFGGPSMQDFCHHTDGAKVSSKGAFETPYISMTSSPLRALKLMQHEETSNVDVFVIDADRLFATHIRFERTTVMAREFGIVYNRPRGYDRAHYITETHWLIEQWIPADCVVERMSFSQFQGLCRRKGILKGIDYPASTLVPGRDSLTAHIIDYPNGPFHEDCLDFDDFVEAPTL